MAPVPSTGPFVAVATFCEKVIQDRDNVLSIIRVVDQLIVTATGPDPPDEMPPTQINLTLAIVLRRGTARGRHKLKLRPEAPGGDQRPVGAEVSVNLVGDEEAGANVVVDFSGAGVDQEGLWWFDVLFGDSDQLLVRVPLRVRYQPQKSPQ